jgi:hypothetical protein
MSIWSKQSLSLPWKPKLQEVFLSNLNRFPRKKNVLDAAALYTDGFLWGDDAFLQFSQIGLIEASRAYLCLESLSCRKYSFQT